MGDEMSEGRGDWGWGLGLMYLLFFIRIVCTIGHDLKSGSVLFDMERRGDGTG